MSAHLHDCAYAEAVLIGEAPPPFGDTGAFEAGIRECPDCSALADALADVDALAASLPELTVPEDLSRRTLDHVLDEMAPTPVVRPPHRQKWPFYVLAGGMSLAATMLLTILPRGPSPAPPERLVARGGTTALPSVSLKVAVDDGKGLARHRRDRQYPVGSRVQFRVGLDRPADVALVRVDEAGAQLVARTSLQSGDHDLNLGNAPLAWEVEPGEADAHFVVIAGPSGSLPDDPTAAVGAGSATVDDTGVCARVTSLACDERLFQVSP